MTSWRLRIPLALPSAANLREHWAQKARRVKAQRATMAAHLLSADVFGLERPPLPVSVSLTRVSPRTLDDDNAVAAMKAPRDEIARWLGVDDADPRVEWRYGQAKGAPREQALLVAIDPIVTPFRVRGFVLDQPPPDPTPRKAAQKAAGRVLGVEGLPTPVRRPKRVPRVRTAPAIGKRPTGRKTRTA